jgi:hypothetical protein
VTGEALVRAFVDAGLPQTYLHKELKRQSTNKDAKKLTLQMLKVFEQTIPPLTSPSPPPPRRIRPSADKGERVRVRGLMTLAQAALAIQYFKIEKCY